MLYKMQRPRPLWLSTILLCLVALAGAGALPAESAAQTYQATPLEDRRTEEEPAPSAREIRQAEEAAQYEQIRAQAIAAGQEPPTEKQFQWMIWGPALQRLAPRSLGRHELRYTYQRTRDAEPEEGSDVPNLDTHTFSARTGFTLIEGKRFFMTLPLSYELTTIPKPCIDDDASDCVFHRLSTGLGFAILATPRWSIFINASAALSARTTEFLTTDALQPALSAGATYIVSQQFSFIFGLTYSNALGRRLVVPILGFVYDRPNNPFRIEALLPQGVSFYWDATRSVNFEFFNGLDGGSSYQGEKDILIDNLEGAYIQDLSVYSSLRMNFRLGSGFGLHPEVGITWYRNFGIGADDERLDENFNITDSMEPRAMISFSWKPEWKSAEELEQERAQRAAGQP